MSIFSEWCQRIAWSPTLNLFVAVGRGGNSHARSTNGINWTGNGALFTEGRGVAWGNGMFIAVGLGVTHNFSRSTDGINWTRYGGKTTFSTRGFNIAYNGVRWVAVGQGTNNSLAYSNDGITWIGLGLSIFSFWALGVEWAKSLNLWVASGQGTNSLLFLISPHTIKFDFSIRETCSNT